MRRLAALCALGLLCCGGVWAGQPLDVRAAYYRIKTPADPGSATVLVRNTRDQAVSVDRLLMDGSPLPAHGIGAGLQRDAKRSAAEQLAAARIIWARLVPNAIPPGRNGLLYVQYRTRPPYAFRLRLMAGKAAAAECRLFPTDAPVRITNIAFPAALSECLIYVANTSKDKAERIQAIELNDADVTPRIWASSRELAPGGKELIVVPKPGLAVGDSATVVVALESGLRIVERVHALPVFPIALEHGQPDPSLGTTDMQSCWPVRATGHGRAEPGGDPPANFGQGAAVLRVFHCPSHMMGSDWQACAAEILRRVARVSKARPRLPAYDAVCRARSDLASASFAHTTDAGFLNPHLPQYSQASPRHPVDAVLRALDMARAANAPDPVYSLVGVYTFANEKQPPSPDELHRLLHAILAGAPRGLLYRLRRDQLTPQLTAGIRRLNDKVRRLKPLLLLAEPVGWATSTNPQVVPRVLLCGRQALVVIILNRGDPPGRLNPAGPTEITVSIPPWLPTLRATPDSDAVDGSVHVAADRIRIRLRGLATAALLVLRTSAPQGQEGKGKDR